jgi:hypothetical protein
LVAERDKKITRIKINNVKATFTGHNSRHTQVGNPEDTQQKPGVDVRAAKGEGHVICEVIYIKTGPYGN